MYIHLRIKIECTLQWLFMIVTGEWGNRQQFEFFSSFFCCSDFNENCSPTKYFSCVANTDNLVVNIQNLSHRQHNSHTTKCYMEHMKKHHVTWVIWASDAQGHFWEEYNPYLASPPGQAVRRNRLIRKETVIIWYPHNQLTNVSTGEKHHSEQKFKTMSKNTLRSN